MPTYALRCHICGDFEQWASITVGAPTGCPDCGGTVQQILTPPRLYAVGERGAQTRDIDEKERQLSADLPAYKRLRHQGYQPQRINGAHEMEMTAQSAMEINSGGIVKGDEKRINSAIELSREIMGGLA